MNVLVDKSRSVEAHRRKLLSIGTPAHENQVPMVGAFRSQFPDVVAALLGQLAALDDSAGHVEEVVVGGAAHADLQRRQERLLGALEEEVVIGVDLGGSVSPDEALHVLRPHSSVHAGGHRGQTLGGVRARLQRVLGRWREVSFTQCPLASCVVADSVLRGALPREYGLPLNPPLSAGTGPAFRPHNPRCAALVEFGSNRHGSRDEANRHVVSQLGGRGLRGGAAVGEGGAAAGAHMDRRGVVAIL